MKAILILVSLLFTTLSSAQIIRNDPPSGGTPIRNRNPNVPSAPGQPPVPRGTGTPQSPTPRRNPACNFNCNTMALEYFDL